MQDYEKLGAFYLGRPYDLATRSAKKGWLLYDSSDLVTHAVCVGMTGSGKTGLCIGLIEEAAIDAIPSIVIDPKGDLSNLLLTFPDFRPEDFRPWINEDDARAKGVAPGEYAEQQASLWKKGLAEWDQDGERVRRLKSAVDFAIYTPGGSAGLPVSVLRSLEPPGAAVMEDLDSLQEDISSTVTGLLGLLGVDADPLRSREHILVSTLLGTAWKAGQSLDLPALITQIQDPPLRKIGVIDLESFFPAKERFALAMSVNSLLASPSFEAWISGEPLDVGRMLYDPQGRPRVSIFSLAHLGDAERMFFVTFLLNRTLGWMRSQSGTTSLRALLYMDEIAGYFPPVANPPSKPPLLSLLKQGRAFGLGVVLATQNPVDLDYKGLANAGTWFIGRLQTERDKARVLDGLEGAAAGAGSGFDRKDIDTILSGLGSRVFLMNNVHESGPTVFQTRWTMSYLRGPLTRDQIRRLMEPRKAGQESAAQAGPSRIPDARAVTATRSEGAGAASAGPSSATRKPLVDGHDGSRPALPPAVPQYFVTLRGARRPGGDLVYGPVILGTASVSYLDKKQGVDDSENVAFTAPVTDAPVAVDWDTAGEAEFGEADLEHTPEEGARFSALPGAAARVKSYEAWGKDFTEWLVRTRTLDLLSSPGTGVVSHPGESERDFRIRLGQASRERRDGAKEDLQRKFAPKIAALADRVRRGKQSVERETEQAREQKMQTAISVGATLLGSLFGRKSIGVGTIGRATTAARGVGRSMRESQDVGRAQETVEVLEDRLAALEAELESELQALEARTDPLTETLATVTLRPARRSVTVRLLALVWAPYWRDAAGALIPAWK